MLNEYPAPQSPRDVVASPTVRPPIDITASLANRVILNATPSRVEVDQTVRFELRFQRPPPPVPNIQYGFNFADGSPVEWTSAPRTTHPYSAAGTYEPSVEIRVGARVLDLPKIVGPTVDVVMQSSPTPTSTAAPAPITPSPTSLHSNRHSRCDSDSIHNADSNLTVAFASLENAMALYRRWPRRRGVGLFYIREIETDGGDCRATRILCAFGLERSAEAPTEYGHQLRIIFSFQFIRRPGPARD